MKKTIEMKISNMTLPTKQSQYIDDYQDDFEVYVNTQSMGLKTGQYFSRDNNIKTAMDS